FFEATAEFISVVFLSAFSSKPGLWEIHKKKINESLQKQHNSFERATFGTWKLVVEYLGKQTRQLLDGDKESRDLCADMFADASLAVPESLSQTEIARVVSDTNKMRNDWTGHGGVIGQDEAKFRNEQLLSELLRIREAMGDIWVDSQLIHAVHTVVRRG